MYCKYAEYACNLQTNLSMTNKSCHNMQKKCNIVFWICRICRYLQKSFSCSAKKRINKNDRICRKMQYRHPPIQEHVVYSRLDFIYILKMSIEFRSFGGICSGILTLQKQGLVAPANQAFGRFWTTVFYGFLCVLWWVFTGFGRFSTGCGEAASSKTWFCWLKPVFFAETSSKPGFDSSTRFFQGFGWCRICDYDFKLW